MASPRVDLGGRQVWPMLIDIHTHLDKGHSVERSPNSDGTFHNARLGAIADRATGRRPICAAAWISVYAAPTRTAFGDPHAYRHLSRYDERSWQARSRDARGLARQDGFAGGVAVSDRTIRRMNSATGSPRWWQSRSGLLGGVTRASVGDHGAPLDNLDAMFDRLFVLAVRHDLDVDLHVDETHDPAAATLPYVARAAMRHGYKGRVVCGHCCSLANQPEDVSTARSIFWPMPKSPSSRCRPSICICRTAPRAARRAGAA